MTRGELALDRGLLRGALRYELRLLDVRRLEPLALLLDLGAEDLHLLEDLRALIRDPVHRVEPVDQVVHRGRPEQDLEPRVLASRRVQRDQMGVEHALRVPEVRPRELQLGLVRPQVALDPGELLVREVVRVDGPLEVRVETLDLGHHALRLGLLRGDRTGVGKRRRGSHEGRGDADEGYSRLPHANAGERTCPGHDGRTGRGPVRHEHGTLTTLPDDRKRTTVPLGKCRLRRGRAAAGQVIGVRVPRRGRAR